MRIGSKRTLVAGSLLALATLTACTSGASDSKPSSTGASSEQVGLGSDATLENMRDLTAKALKGKKVGFVPASLGIPLTDSWNAELDHQMSQLGIDYSVKDPGFDPQKQIQAVQSYIAERPDVLIVHPIDVGLLSDKLQEAERAGIYVIQLNLQSSAVTDAYIGSDFEAEGRAVGTMTSDKCAGKKVGILQALPGSSAGASQLKGFMEVAKKNKIQIVSKQTAGVDPAKAGSLATSMMQQHADLCGIYGDYDEMMIGAGNAVKEAGKLGTVSVFTTGGGNASCEGVKAGVIAGATSANGTRVGIMAGSMVSVLLQSNLKPGTAHFAVYTPITEVDKTNYYKANVCFDVEK